MAKWGMVIDITKCNACYSCFIACKDEYWDNDYPPYSAGSAQAWTILDGPREERAWSVSLGEGRIHTCTLYAVRQRALC